MRLDVAILALLLGIPILAGIIDWLNKKKVVRIKCPLCRESCQAIISDPAKESRKYYMHEETEPKRMCVSELTNDLNWEEMSDGLTDSSDWSC